MIPVVFAFQGAEGLTKSGPSLLFVALPKVFAEMGWIGDVVGAATKPTPAGVINATANVANTALETAAHAAAGYQEYTSFGSNGSLVEVFTEYRKAEIFLQQYASTSTDFTAERGRPVYLKRTNSGGFVQFLSPSLQPPGAMQSEIETINATLASGIYIE